jgi:hypothetical protein
VGLGQQQFSSIKLFWFFNRLRLNENNVKYPRLCMFNPTDSNRLYLPLFSNYWLLLALAWLTQFHIPLELWFLFLWCDVYICKLKQQSHRLNWIGTDHGSQFQKANQSIERPTRWFWLSILPKGQAFQQRNKLRFANNGILFVWDRPDSKIARFDNILRMFRKVKWKYLFDVWLLAWKK